MLGTTTRAQDDPLDMVHLPSDLGTEFKRNVEKVRHNLAGRSRCLSQSLRDALVDYTKAIQIDPDFAMAYNNRGSACRSLGEYTLANAEKTVACSLDSQYP